MYKSLRIFSLGLICLLLIASSDTAVNGSLGGGGFGVPFNASMADPPASGVGGILRQPLHTTSGTEVLNGSSVYGVKLTDPRNETHGSVTSGGPRKEYGRSGRSLVTAQNVSVVSPGIHQTPAFLGDSAVTSPSNTGHDNTASIASINSFNSQKSQTKTCLWSAFQDVYGTKTRVTLKFDWSVDVSVFAEIVDETGFGSAEGRLDIDYSTNGGSNWTSAIIPQSALVSVGGQESDGDSLSAGGSESINLPNPGSIDITQIRVRDRIFAKVKTSSSIPAGNNADASVLVNISNIRLEVETNCIANIPGDRWRGEYYSNTNLSGSPAMVRDDTNGADFLSLNFGGDTPGSVCGLGADNFSARWTRTADFASGVYRFTVTADNGVRLYVDGQKIIDRWAEPSLNTHTADMTFSVASPHEIKLEFVEHTGAASVSLSWATFPPVDLNMALIHPDNRIGSQGEDLLSRNCNWSLPLLSLPGRAGLDLGLALSLNSLT